MQTFTVSSIEHHRQHVVMRLLAPNNGTTMAFLPGQYISISYKSKTRFSHTRCFSITSTPNDKFLEISFRPDSPYTRGLAAIEVGSSIRVQGPFGDFIVDPRIDRQMVFLAAGIGITPFISILRHASETKLQNSITLLYANRDPQEIPFANELQILQRQLPSFRLALFSSASVDKTSGVVGGRITQEWLQKATNDDPQNYSYFVCGPAAFTVHMHKLLQTIGVNTDQVISESFTQTTKLSGFRRLSIPAVTYLATGFAIIAGFVVFSVFDLSRYSSKVKAAAIPTTSTANTSPTTATNSSTTTTQSQPTTTTNTDTQSYQSPVSSVS